MRCFVLLLIATAGLAAGPRNDPWTVVGPGGGGSQYLPTISPHDSNVVLVGCDMTGAYLTKDGGHSWRMFNLRGTPHLFAFDPVNPKVMYAATIGLWRSRDAGDTWELVHPAPFTVTAIAMVDDHAGEQLVSTKTAERVQTLAIDPADSNVLYAVMGALAAPNRHKPPGWPSPGTSARRGRRSSAAWPAAP